MLGKRIKLLRHERGWSQEDAAKQLDMSIPAFSKIETGVTDINLSRIEQIAGLFGLTPVELLDNQGTAEQNKSVSQLTMLQKKLRDRESEIVALQNKIIALFDELK